MMNHTTEKLARLSLVAARARVQRAEDAAAIALACDAIEEEVAEGEEEVAGYFFGRRIAG